MEKLFISKFENLELDIVPAVEFCKEKGLMTSILAEEINEKSLEFLQDRFMELIGQKYVVYKNYANILKAIQKDEKI